MKKIIIALTIFTGLALACPTPNSSVVIAVKKGAEAQAAFNVLAPELLKLQNKIDNATNRAWIKQGAAQWQSKVATNIKAMVWVDSVQHLNQQPNYKLTQQKIVNACAWAKSQTNCPSLMMTNIANSDIFAVLDLWGLEPETAPLE